MESRPSIWQSLLPVGILILLLVGSVNLFGDNASYGPNQVALILSAVVAASIGLRLGFTWKQMQEAMIKGVSLSMGAIFILLAVGSLIGTWILGGVVPTMMYYGLQILNPSIFYAACCIICAIVAVVSGSSWTTVSTIGIALIGIAAAFGLHLGIAAGAIISGSYFGDKLSPLSDTTNLAPAMAGTELFVHIRHMLWTTVPSIILALILFTIIGLVQQPEMNLSSGLGEILQALENSYNLGVHLLIPVLVVLVLIYKKMPAFPALLIGALLGGVTGMIFQQEVILTFVGGSDLPRILVLLQGFWMVMFGEFVANTGNAALDDLLTRGGMSNMLDTIWLILSAMMFGAAMEKTGMLMVITEKILSAARSTGSLILATLGTAFGLNVIAADQYISIVIPGRMYRAEFEKRGLDPKNLSRALEDSGTLTSALVPWNTCGAFMAAALGVPTLYYLPFAFFNYTNPVISAIYGFTGFSIVPLAKDSNDTVSE
ncbi:MAG: Na+/H+ antiporter NhaC [Bacteroidetes bacterium]|nr:Na+/H+ antiporter NhaC [Bacteroidota bacterium]